MKKKWFSAILFIAFSLSCSSSFSQSDIMPKPYVDERIELLSTIFRLAGAREYVANSLPSYMAKVDSFFAPVKEHEIVQFIPSLRERAGIGYDAVMSYATHIEIKNNQINIKSNLKPNDFDSRWEEEDITQFLDLLNHFYEESNFYDFFVQNKAFMDTASSRFTSVLNQVDFSWFEQYYGQKPNGSFNLAISLLNGPNNYGASVNYDDNTEELYAIIGSWAADSLGLPVYSRNVISTIIHEFNHSFCNPLISENYEQMKPVADHFFKLNEEILSRQAYGSSKTLLCEILVRASVIKYFQHSGSSKEQIQFLTAREQASGFTWIDQLGKLLDTYESDRQQYPTLRSFMPEIVKLQNKLSPKKIQKEFSGKCGALKSTSIKNNDQKVDPRTNKLIITFDRRMYTGANGTSIGKKNKEDFMIPASHAYWNEETKKEWVLDIELESGKEYSISLPAIFFYTEDGFPLKETYFLDFKTADNKNK